MKIYNIFRVNLNYATSCYSQLQIKFTLWQLCDENKNDNVCDSFS